MIIKHFCGIFLLAALATTFGCGDDDVTADDAGSDGGMDSGPRCVSDPECDDGLFCTGEETCDDGICRTGTPVLCDDEIECTLDACNEVTNRCEGLAPDVDEDGAGDMTCLDGDGEPLGRDCDDNDSGRFGGNREVCDAAGVDEDCDLTTFGSTDNDLDGFVDARCRNPAADGQEPAHGDDCDDGRRDVNPATTEVCDHVDNNCDGETDEGVLVTVAPDADRDGFPVNDPMMECPGFAGLVAIDEDSLFDCDDTNPARNPGQVEICDEADNDCDENIDEDARAVNWYGDRDGDGFGSARSGITFSCEPVAGSSLLDTDCDDNVAALNPAAMERCNGLDDDCNGRADFEIGDGDFEDDDGDGSADIACGGALGVDCDDRDPLTAGGTTESCDGRDNDCDGRIDENADALQWFYDGDSDGHGTISDSTHPPVVSCAPPTNYVGSGGDCDDMDHGRYPGAPEQCGTIDDDCDGAIDEGLICTCPGGFMTCPGAAPPGCQTNIWNDTSNCGGCGVVCSEFHVDITFCNRGECTIADCEAGFDDCDAGVPGCEHPVLRDDENCGGCDQRCDIGADQHCVAGSCELVCPDGSIPCEGRCIDPLTNSEFCGVAMDCGGPGHSGRCDGGDVCVAGACLVSCPPEMTRCPGDLCVDPEIDIRACGGCGTQCGPYVNGTPDCTASLCGVVCNETHMNCDGVLANGCEASLDVPTSCGGCDACLFGVNSTATCVGRRCGLDCSAGFMNCDGLPANGCEADLTQPATCGGCTACPLEPFASSICNAMICEPLQCDLGRSDCNEDLNLGGDGCETMGPCGGPRLLWNYTYGDSNDDWPIGSGHLTAVEVDIADNVYVVATAQSELGVDGTTHIFDRYGTVVFSLDPTGNHRWSTSFRDQVGGPFGDALVHDIAIDPTSGDIFVAGTGWGTQLQIDGVDQGGFDDNCTGFVVRLNHTNGAVVWSNVFTETECNTAYGVDVAGGTVAVTGSFQVSMDTDGDGATLMAQGSHDGYVRLFGTGGSDFFAWRFGGSDPATQQFGRGVAILDGGDIVVVGFYQLGPTNLNSIAYPNAGNSDGFFVRFNDSGTELDAGVMSTSAREHMFEVEAAPTNRFFVAGVYDGSTTFEGTSFSGPSFGMVIAGMNPTSSMTEWVSGQDIAGGLRQDRVRFTVDSAGDPIFGITTLGGGLSTFGGTPLPGGGPARIIHVDGLTGNVTPINIETFTPPFNMYITGIALTGSDTPVAVGFFADMPTPAGTNWLFEGLTFQTQGGRDGFVMRLSDGGGGGGF